MMKTFIENYLKITDYKITYFTNWRNNITCLVDFWDDLGAPWGWKIIIQKENIDFPENQKFLIDELIKKSQNTELNLAQNYLDSRFIEFDWDYFQVMKNIESTKISDEDFIAKASDENIISTFEYLAKFHNFSNSLIIPEEKKDISKTFKSVDELLLQAEKLNNLQGAKDPCYSKYFQKIIELKQGSLAPCIIETWKKEFSSWIIHWDPAFKNMLFDENINAISLIDYEKVEYNNFLWDIADLARSLLKLEKFDNELLKTSIEKYCKIKNIPDIEKIEIINYLKTLIFHVILQYFLALFPESWVENKIWDNSDTIKKLDRGFWELKKIKNWVIK